MKVTLEELRQHAAAGCSIKEVAAKYGLSYSAIFLRAKRAGIKFKRPPSTIAKIKDASRKEMLDLYRKGATLQQIGDCYGVTRERVRQILTKLYGINARHGGARLLSRRRAISRAAGVDTKFLAKHGCSFAQYKELIEIGRALMREGATRERTPLGAFITQRNNARRSGYPWKLKLWEWWTVWQQVRPLERAGSR